MDPRIRKRRVEIRRREGRRRLLVVIGALAVVVVAASAWGVSRSPLLDVDRIELVGTVNSDGAEIVRASGVRRGTALVDVDVSAAARGVERVPWVLRATVGRRWGGTVTIRVTERVPVAAARGAEGTWVMVDAHRRVLATASERPPGLPPVAAADPVGPPGSHLSAEWGPLLEVAVATPPTLLGRVTAITGADGGGVELSMAPGGVIRFGAPEQVKEKFRAIDTVLAHVDGREVAVLDVRIPRTPVLTRRDPPARVSTRTEG